MVLAGCGGCQGDNKTARRVKDEVVTKVNSLITSVPKNGQVEGLIITSCGICNLEVKTGGCSLFVKIGNSVYPVKGTNIRDHGDEHASEGFCSATRIARTKGLIKKDVFYAESFVVIGN
tara:strand:+ start:216 stop:572 length:357 start_codon:yes stop_codon:yes gene_type:complete